MMNWNIATHRLIAALVLMCGCGPGGEGNQDNAPDSLRSGIPQQVEVIAPAGYALQGDTVTLICTRGNDSSARAGLFFFVSVCHADNAPPHYDLVPPDALDGNTFSRRYVIPPTAVWVEVYASDGNRLLNGYGNRRFPVLRSPDVPAHNTSLYAMMVAPREEYYSFFSTERELYPDNPVAFAAKWDYQLSRRLCAPDTVMNDLRLIERLPESPEKTIVQFIGYRLTEDERTDDYLQRIRSLTGANAFNNWMLIGCLQKTLRGKGVHATMVGERELMIVADLMRNNPGSEYTRFRMQDGTIRKIPPHLAIDICNRLIASDLSLPVLAAKLSVLSHSYLPDSAARALETATLLDSLLADTSLAVRKLDPSGTSRGQRDFLRLLLADVYLAGRDAPRAERTIRAALEHSPPYSPLQAMAFQRLVDVFRVDGNRDSLLLYLGYACCAGKYFTPVKDSAWNEIVRVAGNPAVARDIVEKAGIALAARTPRLPGSAPAVRVATGASYPLAHLDRDLIIEFISPNCEPCYHTMRRLAALRGEGKLENATVILAGREDPEELVSLCRKLGVTFDIALDGPSLFSYFNVQATPVILRVGPGGTIRYRIDGGGDEQVLY